MSNSNSSMHPRNLYRHKPPDFKQLMIKYPDFKRHCKLELNGKVIASYEKFVISHFSEIVHFFKGYFGF